MLLKCVFVAKVK